MRSTLITEETAPLGRILAEGGIVIFPTETVYGMGADSTNFDACHKIYQIKNRPLDNPLIAHFDTVERIETYCVLPKLAYQLLDYFSPGPLTLVLRKKSRPIFSLGLETLAVRIPGHLKARKLIADANVPISAPSANPSGKPSFTREKDVIDFYRGKVDGILLGKEPEIGIESTVLDLSGEKPVLLRPGQITLEELHLLIPDLLYNKEMESHREIRSPGLKYKHYSPDAKVILLDQGEFLKKFKENETNPQSAFIGFHLQSARPMDKKISDNRDYMKSLYAFFIDSDKNKILNCYCESPLQDGYYLPLMNRLTKASNQSLHF